jgi:RNA polymerase sigma-70 factor (ECF subfamily)
MAEDGPVHALRLEEGFERHHAELVAFLARRAPREAEELAQEVWVRMARAAPICPDDASFRGYLFTVARRLLVDHYRKPSTRVHLVALEGGERPSAEDPEGAVRAGDVLAVVEAELGAMKAELAEVFRWRTTEDVPFTEIARRQGTGINTALGRMHRATLRIAAALVERGLIVEEER